VITASKFNYTNTSHQIPSSATTFLPSKGACFQLLVNKKSILFGLVGNQMNRQCLESNNNMAVAKWQAFKEKGMSQDRYKPLIF